MFRVTGWLVSKVLSQGVEWVTPGGKEFPIEVPILTLPLRTPIEVKSTEVVD